MSDDRRLNELVEKLAPERRRRARTRLDAVAARKRQAKGREATKAARVARKKQRR